MTDLRHAGDSPTDSARMSLSEADTAAAASAAAFTTGTGRAVVHPSPVDSRHQLKEDSLADAVAGENRAYKADSDYHAHGLAQFAKLRPVTAT
jgi:hypothetical protein